MGFLARRHTRLWRISEGTLHVWLVGLAYLSTLECIDFRPRIIHRGIALPSLAARETRRVRASLIDDSERKTTGVLLREIAARWRAGDRARRRQNGYTPFARAETVRCNE